MRIAIDSEFSFDDDCEFFAVCVAVTQEDGETHTWWHDQLDDLKSYIVSHKSDTWVAHNVETAEGYLFQSLGLKPTSFRWHDTLLMSKVAHNYCTSRKRLLHGLADCLEREDIAYRDHAEKKSDQSICIYRPEKTTWNAHLAMLEMNKEHLMEYCLKDTADLLALDTVLDETVSEDFEEDQVLDRATYLHPTRRAAWFGFLSAYMSECGWRGIPLSRERVKNLKYNAPHAVAYLQKCFEKKYPGTFRHDKKKLTKNVKVCREYAAAQYGEDAPRTESGEVSLASKYTKEYEQIGGFLWDYHELDKHCRALASFCKADRNKNWLGHYLVREGVVRPRISLLSSITGRCGSKPSSGFIFTMGKPFRGLIDPPEGRVLVELDYHSEEIACQAYLSGDTTMAEMYDHPHVDDDYYTTLAVDVFGATPEERDTYKVIALMSNYGCGAQKLTDVSKKDFDFCDSTLDTLKDTFDTYWSYDDECIEKCRKWGYIAFSDGWRVMYDKKRPGKATTLINWPFQGVGALILRKMLFKLWQADIELVAPVHDAVVFLADEATWKETTAIVTKCMEDAAEECLGKKIGVGAPEVTFHGLPNCHSELCRREDYVSENYPPKKAKKIKKYYALFNQYLTVSDEDIPDTENLYVDEEFDEEGDE